MSCCSGQDSICPCEGFVHPARISNVAGLDQISYRVGDYTTFREALLRALPGEVSLTATQPAGENGSLPSPANAAQLWRPGASGDLAVQMIEWWAYLADILTFYNERIATQAYLRTADRAITVNRLVRLLGYRPKPAIGATGTLAALMKGTASFSLRQGFQIQSKPGPGQQPQIFELAQDIQVALPDTAPVFPPPQAPQLASGTALIQGSISSVGPGDMVFLVKAGWDGTNSNYAVGIVQSVSAQRDPSGHTNTLVLFSITVRGGDLPDNASPADYRLLRSNSVVPLYQYLDPSWGWSAVGDEESTNGVIPGFVELASIVREIKAGDAIVLQDTSANSTNLPLPGVVTVCQEVIYYANNPTDPEQPPGPPGAGQNAPAGIPIPHTRLTYDKTGFTFGDAATDATTVVVRYGWKDVGLLISAPATSVGGDASANRSTGGAGGIGTTIALQPGPGASFPTSTVDSEVLIEDAIGNGTLGKVISTSSVSLTGPVPTLMTPLQVLFNLLPVTRGKAVANEVLGSGNAAVAGQDFTLKKSPVTYLQDSGSVSGPQFSSTIQVWVNKIKWTEVQSFYPQPANAQVFITKEDEQGQTHVIFGDGVNGARPPTGVNNIIATYRYGSGANSPAAGLLTMILKPLPGLKGIVNPIAVSGGADADPPDQVRQYAPQSVLTFNRAVSLDDFEAIAATAPGVTRAQAALTVNPVSQQPQIQVYVLPGNALTSVRKALQGIADPTCSYAVLPATPIYAFISATLIVASNADPTTVQANATNALAGQNSGLFVFDPNSGTPGVYILGIGQPVYDSEIYAALQVPGVLEVVGYSFGYNASLSGPKTQCRRQRHDPQAGVYFALAVSNLSITTSPAASS